VTEQDALNALGHAVPDLDRHLANGNLELVSDHEWYLGDGTLDPNRFSDLNRLIERWIAKHADAVGRGYTGMRASGGTCWLQERDWSDFSLYEEKINESIGNLSMTCLCSYAVAASGAAEVLDVARTHQFMVARRHGIWEVLETAELRQAKSEIKRLNDALERRVIERTGELTAVNQELSGALEEVNHLRQRLGGGECLSARGGQGGFGQRPDPGSQFRYPSGTRAD
jgi:DcmR-like sensory protein